MQEKKKDVKYVFKIFGKNTIDNKIKDVKYVSKIFGKNTIDN